ncbi:endonuclease [Mycolicibacterium goodii]|uniref:endonuclease n=1 Tax=Mycolicibacterium goodii TaxID=134601 RepID=UPI001BDBF67F|nr:endonuclease [Mycolicibacterium goodii]MBU8818913.1 endonuclease [Mycolicibacterium goodii]
MTTEKDTGKDARKDARKDVVRRLLDAAGRTYADDAGIHLADKPMPLFELLVLCMLASKPIDAGLATAAARELFGSGLRTPSAVLGAERHEFIEAFGRAHYVRYDESSATRLTDMATLVTDRYGGDLRRLAAEAGRDVDAARRLLKEFKGIGDTGADIFLREVQDTWTWVRPFFDERTLEAARDLGLPADPAALEKLAGRRTAELAAALVRTTLDDDLRRQVSRTQEHATS